MAKEKVVKKVTKNQTKKKSVKKVETPVEKVEIKEVKKSRIEKNDKVITVKNYVIVFVGLLVTVLLAFYVRALVVNYIKNVASVSVFSKNASQINFSDLDYAVKEVGESIVVVSYSGDSSIRKMEDKLYKEIEKRELTDKIIYLDVTNERQSNSYLSLLKKQFPEIANQITAAPLFIYIKNGVAVEAMSSELNMINYKVFDKLIEKYEIE